MRRSILVLLTFLFPALTVASAGDTDTFASKTYFGDGKFRTAALFDFPYGFTLTPKGTFLIADTHNHVIRRIKSSGGVRTIAGTGSYGFTDGPVRQAEFAEPRDVAGRSGTFVVADTGNNAIRKIHNGQVTTLADGLHQPEGVAIKGGTVYFSDSDVGAIKRVPLAGGAVTTVTTSLGHPNKLSLSVNKNNLLIADSGRRQILQMNLRSGHVSVVAGSGNSGLKDGTCNEAKFTTPYGIDSAEAGVIMVTDRTGSVDVLREITLDERCQVTTIHADRDNFSVGFPRDVQVSAGKAYMLLTGFGIIQSISVPKDIDEEPVTFAGANRFNVKRKNPVLFGRPQFLALSPNKRTLLVGENNRIRKMSLRSKSVAKVVSGSVVDNYAQDDLEPRAKARARFSQVTAFGVSGKWLYVVDRHNNRIRKVNRRTGVAHYLTGAGKVNSAGGNNGMRDGNACPNEFRARVSRCAYLSEPIGGVLSKNKRFLYVADSGNNAIRRVTVKAKKRRNIGKVKTIAGARRGGYVNGFGRSARFRAPTDIALSKSGKVLFVTDRDNHVIRKINLKTKEVTTIAGEGRNGFAEGPLREAVFSLPSRITRGPNKHYYISDVGSNRITVMDLERQEVRLVSGSGERGFQNGAKDVAKYNNPADMLVVGNRLLVADMFNDMIRVIQLR